MFFVNHVKIVKDKEAKLKIFSPTRYVSLKDARDALEKIAQGYLDVSPNPLFSDHCFGIIQACGFNLCVDTIEHPHGSMTKTNSDGSCEEVWYITDGTLEDEDWEITGNIFEQPMIDKIIFNHPATIVFWDDGTKTVVKCQKDDVYNKETGLAMAMLKRYMGNDNTYNKEINFWLNACE